MAVFPTLSIPPKNDYQEEMIKPIVKTQFEGNYAQTRPKYTRLTKKFTLKFRPIIQADKVLLETFFNDNSGGDFTWENPTDLVTYTIRFGEDTLKFKRVLATQFEISIPLEQV